MNPFNIRVWNGGGFDYPREHSSWSSFWDVNNPEYEHLVFQWGSGVTDTNGQEIYEGDILQLSDGRSVEIYFASGAFLMKGCDLLYFGVKRGEYDNGKIIGNILENTELLQYAHLIWKKDIKEEFQHLPPSKLLIDDLNLQNLRIAILHRANFIEILKGKKVKVIKDRFDKTRVIQLKN